MHYVKRNKPSNPDQFHAERRERFMNQLKPIHASLARYVRAMAKNREDAQDLLAETILKAWEYFDDVRDTDSMAAYIFTIARRLARRHAVVALRFTPIADNADELYAIRSTTPEDSADVALLYDALRKLSFKEREAFVLFEVNGYSLQDIADLQECGLSAIKMRLTRARERLRKLLSDTVASPVASSNTNQLVL
jgi:RNA polymerase sigma-70 factor (ECF subfamily)